MITHVLKLNYLEQIADGYEEGPRFTILAGDEEAEILEKLHFTEGVTVDSDYLVAEFTATGTNGVSLRPGDQIVYAYEQLSGGPSTSGNDWGNLVAHRANLKYLSSWANLRTGK